MSNPPNALRIESLLDSLRKHIPDAGGGLPQDVFYFVSTLTPMVNVDLLVQDEQGRTLLVWREDLYYKGWHIAGGIIRFKELATDRIRAVAASELGATVIAEPEPAAIHEKINHERDIRGHFIALLYRCKLTSPLDESRRCSNRDKPLHGHWAWHSHCPDNLLSSHEVYRKLFRPKS